METRFKYPRTYHLPWSLGSTNDDKFVKSLDPFLDMDIVVTIKKDGENFSGYSDGFHARSLDSKEHKSRKWIKEFWNSRKHDVPSGFRICGENLYAKHSIYYDNLKSYFMGFSIWNNDLCLSWKETLEWFSLLDIEPVEVIYEGKFNEDILKNLVNSIDLNKEEGYVIRNKNEFLYNDFSTNVAKFVRQNHIQTSDHWIHQEIIPNKLI